MGRGRGVRFALAGVLALGGCAAAPAGAAPDLARAGCPGEIVVRLDSLPRVEFGALYRLLDTDELEVGSRSVRAPLVVDGRDTGVQLHLDSGDRYDGVGADRWMHRDPGILLGAVDSDRALADATRFPVVGVFAPIEHDPAVVYWDADVYENVRGVSDLQETLTPDSSGLVPIVVSPDEPAFAFLQAEELVAAEQLRPENPGTPEPFLAAGGVVAQQGDALVDVPRLEADGREVGFQALEEAAYPRYAGMLAATPDNVVRFADCLRELVPVLQQSSLDYLDDPQPTLDLLVELSTAFGATGFDAEAARTAFDLAVSLRVLDEGGTPTVGDIEPGRMLQMIETALPALRAAGFDIPAEISPADLSTDAFIDPGIRADTRLPARLTGS